MSLIIATMCAVCARRYAGHILGVSVNVELDQVGRMAHVHLCGAPLLGRVAGYARFDRDGSVVMDDSLRDGLSRRGCSVVDVTEHGDFSQIDVCVKLPIVGFLNISLLRDSRDEL